ncbi:MAG: hypothetical protein GF320_08240 [Armatimonadia bacterium]|nr:hypothetical protein [Armatimonadia bacterium]
MSSDDQTESTPRPPSLDVRTMITQFPVGRLVLAVLLGMGIWLARTIADNPVETYRTTLDVSVRGTEPGVSAEPTLEPRQVTVTLIGQREDVRVYEEGDLTLRASVRYADMAGESGEVPVEVTPIIAGVTVDSITPERVSYNVRMLDLKMVPVDVRVVSQSTEDPLEPIVLPDRVTVRGEKAIVERITRVEAVVREFDLIQRVMEEVTVRPVTEDGLPISLSQVEVDPPQVLVQLPAEAMSAWVDVRPEFTGQPAEGYEVKGYTVEPQSVEVSGPRTALEALGGTLSTDPVQLEGRKQRFQSSVSLRPPETVVPNEISTVLITVEIGPEEEPSG